MFCTNCGASNKEGVKFCTSCGSAIKDRKAGSENKNLVGGIMGSAKKFYNENNKSVPKKKDHDEEMLEIQRKQLKLQEQQMKSMAKCPRCGSTSLSGQKKGFGIGKAVIGGAVAGPIGLVAGNIGAKKVNVTCLNCGKRFKA